MEIPSQQASECGFGARQVRVLPNTFVPMSDGVRLALRLWLPMSETLFNDQFPGESNWLVYSGIGADDAPLGEAAAETFPVVLEYLPYRKDDVTAARDHRRHAWMASHGFVIARADLRGSGDSDGFCTDEYSVEELQDGRQLIGWLANQSWSNGRVGVYGKSWGGFNGLQLAELGCPGLAAVVSIYSSDDRFNCDIHCTGGCVIGTDALTWSSFMLTINSLPPSPAVRQDDWLTEWRARLNRDDHRPWIDTWLRHQTPDEYWRRGSVRFSDGNHLAAVPTLLIGGWRDLYSSALLRLADRPLANGSGRCCALLGPWSHDWPDTAAPGPNLAFADECLRWWWLHLTDAGAALPRPPRFRAFRRVDEPSGATAVTASARHSKLWQGCWLAADSYRDLLAPGGVEFHLAEDQQLVPVPAQSTGWFVEISSRVECGLAYPEFLSFGDPDEAPDQSFSNRMSTVWLLDHLAEDLDLFGSAEVTLSLRIREAGDDGVPCVASPTVGVRLSDGDPVTGRETLVAWGVANLNLPQDELGLASGSARRFSDGRIVIPLRPATHRFRRGHRILLALSNGLWPLAWRCPSSRQQKLRMVADSESNFLRLPVLRPDSELTAARELAQADEVLSLTPRLGPPLPAIELVSEDRSVGYVGSFGSADPAFRRRLEWDLVSERWTHHLESHYCPPVELLLPDRHRVQISWKRHYRTSIGPDDAEPKSEAEHRLELAWPVQQVAVTVLTCSSLGYDADGTRDDFVTAARIRVLLNGEEFFARSYQDRISNATAC